MQPNTNNRAVYERAYRIYRALYENLRSPCRHLPQLNLWQQRVHILDMHAPGFYVEGVGGGRGGGQAQGIAERLPPQHAHRQSGQKLSPLPVALTASIRGGMA